MTTINYQVENSLSVEEFIQILKTSTLGEGRPIQNFETIARMLAGANLILTSRMDGNLVGVARSLTDYVYCTYLSDLAVHQDYQHKGIGKELIRRTKLQTPKAKLILLAAPKAIPYYPKIGMTQYENCYILDDATKIT